MPPYVFPPNSHKSLKVRPKRTNSRLSLIVVLMQLDCLWYLKDIFHSEGLVVLKIVATQSAPASAIVATQSAVLTEWNPLQVVILERWDPAAARHTVEIASSQSTKTVERRMHTTSQGEICLLIFLLMAAQLGRRSKRPLSRTWQVFYCLVPRSNEQEVKQTGGASTGERSRCRNRETVIKCNTCVRRLWNCVRFYGTFAEIGR